MGDSTRVTASGKVQEINNGDSGMLNVPAHVQRELGVCIDTELEVTISGFDDKFVDSVTFENKQIGGDAVTIPAELMRKVDGLEQGETVNTEFALAESEDDGENLSDSTGAEGESEADSVEDLLEDLNDDIEDDEEEAESTDEGLGELFG